MAILKVIEGVYASVISREFTFMSMLGTSLLIAGSIRLLGKFRYKKELLSIVGIIQLVYFCTWDIFHILVMTVVGTALIKLNVFGPRIVFVYCILHRILFSSSKYLGLPRNESNLANASLFITTLKMIIVAYEVSDYRKKKKGEEPEKNSRMKWIDLDHEPSSYDICCYMTCYAAIFTGPIFRYKTYNDMLYKFVDVPIREELLNKLKECAILSVMLCLSPYYVNVYTDGTFYRHNFFMRLFIMGVAATTQGIKYTIAWLLTESVCLLIGLGVYPAATKPIVVMGPSEESKENVESNDKMKISFKTISNINFYNTMSSATVKEALQTWNQSVQWWLAYFVYVNPLFPRNWKVIRALSVLISSAILHGAKLGYFMSFPMITICLAAEEVWKVIEARITWNKILIFAYRMFYFVFVKMLVLFYLITIFILQDKDRIFPFCMATYYYGYIVPIVFLVAGLSIKFILPRNTAEV